MSANVENLDVAVPGSFFGNYRGLVVDNLDPDGLGRIKVKVYPMFKSIEDPVQIPWAVPAMGLFSGAGLGFGSFAVPEMNTFVYVFFEAGNIYQPVYFAEAQTAITGIPTASQIDYPWSKVWETSTGVSFWVNGKQGSEQVVVYHPSGSYVDITPGGNILIYGKDSVIVQAEDGDVSLVAASNNVNITAAKDVNVTASGSVKVSASKSVSVTAGTSASVRAGGSVDVEATGNVSVTSLINASVTAKDVEITSTNAYITAKNSASITGASVEVIATREVSISAPRVDIN